MRYEEILEKLNQSLAYFEEIGLGERAQQSRFIEYTRLIEHLCEIIRTHSIDSLPPQVEEELRNHTLEYVLALTESMELTDALPYLKTCDSKIAHQKIRKILSGPLLPRDEDQNSNEARNTIFELNLASKLYTVGLNPSLGTGADVECMIEGKRLLIECKRPLSDSSVKMRIKKAKKQVEADLKKTAPGSRVVIAVSLSKIMNPTDKFFAFLEESSAREKLADLLEAEAEKTKRSWTNLGRKVIGIIFHVITPSIDRKDSKFSLGQQWNAHPLATDGSTDYAAFKSLFDALMRL